MIRDLVDEFRGGILPGVGGEDAIHAVLAHEDAVGHHLLGAKSRAGVGGEIRTSDAAAKDDDASFQDAAGLCGGYRARSRR